ncbi:hypothetical protein IWW36_000433 [Coemansia brasiliensis]|uniref:Uncharacterized protein n=1 Tax=Coemansia brasiliensis TaxID=2650707 RepID=A0A9W8IAY5_9FUNG|nr:hypothetical protein IWW36_000433 [Coemansia brasiliensis]
MTLEDTSQRNLDRVGGIIAAVSFTICLFVHGWQWARHRCHALAPLFFFLILRVVGWLLAFAGAVKDDRLLNKRGYIVNALAFWLMMLTGFLLLARWDASRRGVRWGARSWGGTGASLILCVVFGALDAAGQIIWLNNAADTAGAVMKVASVGFLVLAVVYALASLFFNYREAVIYQQPTVRWAFFLSATFLVIRCVFWMLVALNIFTFDEPKRLIFLFCLTTTFEIATAAIWGFFPIAKHLRLRLGSSDDGQSIKPISVAEESLRLNGGIAAPPIHREESEQTEDEQPHDHSNNQKSASDDVSEHNTPPGNSYSNAAMNQSRISAQPSSYSSYYQNPMDNAAPNPNPWAGASSGNAPNTNSMYSPSFHSYAQPNSQPVMVGHQSYMQPTQAPLVRIPPQQRPAQLQTFGNSYNSNVVSNPNGPSISFATPQQSPYMGMQQHHTPFVKTPYPQPLSNQQAPSSYVEGPGATYTADYFNSDESSRATTHPSDNSGSYGNGSTPNELHTDPSSQYPQQKQQPPNV